MIRFIDRGRVIDNGDCAMPGKFDDRRDFARSPAAPKFGPGRHVIPAAKAKRDFTRSASKTHVKNFPSVCPMRGGIRL